MRDGLRRQRVLAYWEPHFARDPVGADLFFTEENDPTMCRHTAEPRWLGVHPVTGVLGVASPADGKAFGCPRCGWLYGWEPICDECGRPERDPICDECLAEALTEYEGKEPDEHDA